MSRARFTIIGALFLLLLAAVAAPAQAYSLDGGIGISCTGFTIQGNAIFDRHNADTGDGEAERVTIEAKDGANTTLFTVTFAVALGTYNNVNDSFNYIVPPAVNPITVTVTSVAGLDFPDALIVAQASDNCTDLVGDGGDDGGGDPPVVPVLPPPRVTPGGGVPLTPFAVVGNMPFATQAFFTPDQIAPGVVIPSGTYWVVGQDESGQYYKIVLANNYLWVPIGSMQPSFQAPWLGQPLPTQPVR